MTTAIEATDKDFQKMTQMLTGFFVTQIAGAVATYSIADHLANGPATGEDISKMEGIDPTAAFRLLRACASLGLVIFDLNMMVMLTGRECTLAEYSALLKDAGLRLSKSTPIRAPMAVIEAIAA
jgi:hypothetical protein